MLSSVSEFNYMTQLVFRLYEDKSKPTESPYRFVVEILFSTGACGYRDTGFPTSRRQSVSQEYKLASGIASIPIKLTTCLDDGSVEDRALTSPTPSLRSLTPVSRDISPNGDGDLTPDTPTPDEWGYLRVSHPEKGWRVKSNEQRRPSEEFASTRCMPTVPELGASEKKCGLGHDPVFRVTGEERKRGKELVYYCIG